MSLVKVWNDNVHPYRELYKEQNISIPPKRFIVMDEDEAHQFKGSYSPIKVDGSGAHLKEGFKMIRVEKMSVEDQAKFGATAEAIREKADFDENVCMACGFAAATAEALDEHAIQFHMDQVLTTEKEEEVKASKAANKKSY